MYENISEKDYITIGEMFENLSFQIVSELKPEYITPIFHLDGRLAKLIGNNVSLKLKLSVDKDKIVTRDNRYLPGLNELTVLVDNNEVDTWPVYSDISYCYCILDSILDDDHISAHCVAPMIETIGEKIEELMKLEKEALIFLTKDKA